MSSIEQKREQKKLQQLMIALISIIAIFSILYSGCIQSQKGFPIVVVGRDSASGSREFFWEYVMKKENFSVFYLEKNSNGGIYQSVTQTPGAIGYVGLGYVDNGVKALTINNITANPANVLSGTYPIARNLYVFTKGNATGASKEFIAFIQSTEGQAIVQEEGFVPIPTTQTYNSTGKSLSGILSIGGSTTVFPIIEKAKETFMILYPGLQITVSSTGSGAGITAVGAGTVDIGMSSRDLKSSESNLGLVKYTIASDAIVLIVNPENTYVDNLSLAQVKAIYKGQITNWNEFS
ncbi:MAG: substrate-binding domain-containing protein [Thermoplasmata archaeon]|nr:substrate-binding domain-containing protein [Thermoplasmata archaeon]